MKTKYLKFLSTIAAMLTMATFLFSCNYEEKDLLDGKGISIIRFANLSSRYKLAAFSGGIQTKGIVTIKRDAVSQGDMNTATSIAFEVIPDSLDAYNTANDKSFVLLDPSVYTFVGSNGNVVDFAAGEDAKEIQIQLDPSTLDLSIAYAIPLVIKNPGGNYHVSLDANTAIVQIIVQNPYDATYQETGTVLREGNPADDLDALVEMSTVDATTVRAQAGKSVFGNPAISYLATINPDNTVTIKADPTAGVVIGPIAANGADGSEGKENSYDPSTQTFYLNYQYLNGSGLARTFHTKMVRQ